MILMIFKKLIELYRKMFWPLEKQARNVGVHIGGGATLLHLVSGVQNLI